MYFSNGPYVGLGFRQTDKEKNKLTKIIEANTLGAEDDIQIIYNNDCQILFLYAGDDI